MPPSTAKLPPSIRAPREQTHIKQLAAYYELTARARTLAERAQYASWCLEQREEAKLRPASEGVARAKQLLDGVFAKVRTVSAEG
jgi:hypothetical protein